jgi:hypothetical protein
MLVMAVFSILVSAFIAFSLEKIGHDRPQQRSGCNGAKDGGGDQQGTIAVCVFFVGLWHMAGLMHRTRPPLRTIARTTPGIDALASVGLAQVLDCGFTHGFLSPVLNAFW